MRNHLAAAAFAAALALAVAAPARAQKALVYCPVGVDATGCDRIVTALQSKFAGGVDRGYDGSNGTQDLKAIDLNHYSVFVVPSLADDDDKQPYAVLRAAAARLHLAINGRVAVYSGAPDQGNTNRADKDAIIQNLATWAAAGHTHGTSLVGMVALLDLSIKTSDRYAWVRSISLADVSADAELQSFGEVTPVSSRNGDALLAGGAARRFANMASYGLHIGSHAAARTEVGALGRADDDAPGGQSVLVLYANVGVASGPTLTTDKPDYLPGDTVLFTGTGWAPGDTVTITVHEDPQWSNPDRTVSAVADGSGNLRSHDFIVQQRDFGVTFTATAVGNPSGLVAQVTFTDGTIAQVSNSAVGSTSPTPGVCGTTPASFLVGTEYCGQTTISGVTGTGIAGLFARWVRPNGSVACSTSMPSVVVGSTYIAKCTLDAPSTATADWFFQLSSQSTFSALLDTVRVHVASNTPPVANDDSYGTNEDVALTVAASGILGNDTDGENNPLTAVLVSGPVHGSLVLNANGSFTYTPSANYNGSDGFTYKANDGTASSNTAAIVTITINAVNDAPSFAKGADQTANENAGAQSVAGWATSISAGPPDEAGQTLTFEVSNDNTALFSAQPSIDASGKLTYTSAPDAFGSANVTVKLHDSGGTANGGVDVSAPQQFTITIGPVNNAPTFGLIASHTVLEDAGAQSVPNALTNPSAGPANEAGQALTLTVTNDNNALFSAQPSINLTTGALTYTPAANANGSAIVTVTLKDDGGTANGGVDQTTKTLAITVTAVNDAPSFTKGADQASLEDGGPKSVSGWATSISAGPPDEAAQALNFVVTNSNNTLFSSQPAVDATGKLTYTPAPNANGSATVTVKLHDDGGVANGGVDTSPDQTFTITVTPVNDAPTFDLIANNTANEDAGPQTVHSALTNVSPGPNESAQKLTLILTNSNSALFSVQPSIDLGTGTLTYTSAPNANGSATLTVKLQDDGGTANGGADQTTKTFTITVTPVNDAPVITAFSGPSHPIAVGGSVSVAGTFTDVDLGDTPPDSHTGTIDWGDGSTTALTIASSSGTSRDFSGSHTYATTGVYTIEVYVKDAGGLGAEATYEYAVVTDVNGGFVTGGGWINSPAGKAAFGLVSRYNKGQSTPDGNTEFQAPGLSFKSTSSEWLVISGAKAQYKGSGTINGSGDYGFMVTTIDGSLKSKGASDAFRIKIWDKSTGSVIYDNQPRAPDTADPTMAIGGGSISIHN